MRRIVVLGDPGRVRGFRLAGATVIDAVGARGIERAWASLPDDTAVLVVTADVATVLADRFDERPRVTWAVMPR